MIAGQKELYLDWNATSPPHPRVIEAMRAAAAEAWGNPSSVHAAGRRARAELEDAREALAAAVGFDAREVVLTSGGTEANNWALHSALALVTSRIEHPSVVRAAEALERAGKPVVWLPVPSSGRIEADAIRKALGSLGPGALVALMAANHETGVLQPIADAAEIAHAHGARLHVDAVQALGKLDAAFWQGADSISVAAHKIRGPKGSVRSPGGPAGPRPPCFTAALRNVACDRERPIPSARRASGRRSRSCAMGRRARPSSSRCAIGSNASSVVSGSSTRTVRLGCRTLQISAFRDSVATSWWRRSTCSAYAFRVEAPAALAQRFLPR